MFQGIANYLLKTGCKTRFGFCYLLESRHESAVIFAFGDS